MLKDGNTIKITNIWDFLEFQRGNRFDRQGCSKRSKKEEKEMKIFVLPIKSQGNKN